MQEIQLYKNYVFEVNYSFGDLSEEEVTEIISDGRVASHLLERQLCKWFPDLTFVNKKGYDHVDNNGQKYDQKCWTKGGLGFAPAHMGGKGRVFIQEEAHEHAKNIIYICCDVTELPKVTVQFKHGSDLIKKYPKCRVKKSEKSSFFS